MTPLLTALLAFLGSCVAAAVAFLLGRRKSDADADSVVVAAAERVVVLLRADLESGRVKIDGLEAKIVVLEAHVDRCDADNRQLRIEVAAGRTERVDLRARIDHLESELRSTVTEGLRARVDLLEGDVRRVAPPSETPTKVEVINDTPMPVVVRDDPAGAE